MHCEVMPPAELSAKPVVGNTPAVATRSSIILLLATLLSARFLSSRFLPAFFRSSRFLSSRFLSPGFRPRRFLSVWLLLCWLHLPAWLRFLLSLFLLICSRRLGLILSRTARFILFGLGLRLILPLRFFLSRFVFLLFFVLRVKNRRTRDQSREDS
jgi:hypothetical protein